MHALRLRGTLINGGIQVSENTQTETRTGYRFFGRVGPTVISQERQGARLVDLYLVLDDGTILPVANVLVDFAQAVRTRPESYVDAAFQMWLKEGLFRKAITDPQLLEILEQARTERMENVPGHMRSYRFLHSADSTHDEPRFIFTDDKSDVEEKERQERMHAERMAQEQKEKARENKRTS